MPTAFSRRSILAAIAVSLLFFSGSERFQQAMASLVEHAASPIRTINAPGLAQHQAGHRLAAMGSMLCEAEETDEFEAPGGASLVPGWSCLWVPIDQPCAGGPELQPYVAMTPGTALRPPLRC
jgi:hypothetical protein